MRCLNCNLTVPKDAKVCPKCGCDLTVDRENDFTFYDDERKPHRIKHRYLWAFTAAIILILALSHFMIQN